MPKSGVANIVMFNSDLLEVVSRRGVARPPTMHEDRISGFLGKGTSA